MILKPRKSNLNAPLIHFKRYEVDNIGQIIKDYDTIYKTLIYDSLNGTYTNIQFWKFNKEAQDFDEVSYNNLTPLQKENVVDFIWSSTIPLVYVYDSGANAYYTEYSEDILIWHKVEFVSLESLEETYSNHGTMKQETYMAKSYKMPKNVYYNSGKYNYVISGSINESVGQPVKGLIISVADMTIRIDQENDIREQDLVVLDGRLYIVESQELSLKKMPRPFNIKYLTIHNIV